MEYLSRDQIEDGDEIPWSERRVETSSRLDAEATSAGSPSTNSIQ